jgi:4-hydroxyphenylacetate 3-monooxygenase
MALRTGAQYLDALRDGREVWLAGERVDVTTHPQLAPTVREVADVYDLQHDPEHRDLLTMASPDTGEPVSLAYLLPRSTEDLVRRRQMIEYLMRRNGGTMGRLPEYMATILMGLYNARDLLAQEDPVYASRVEEYFVRCREHDLCLTHGFTDPAHDRTRAADFEPLRLVERRGDGIVIRGAKAVATLAPFADEYLGITAHRPDLKPEEVLYFATPMAAPGVRTICRESFIHTDAADHHLSSAYDEMDAWIVFDDVFIPNERVFLLDRVDLNARVFGSIPYAWAFYHILIRQSVKAEVLAGICVAMAEYMGTSQQPQTQTQIAEILGYVETLRTFIFAAEHQPIYSSFGLAIPNPKQTIQGRIHFMERLPYMLQLVRDLCGSGLLMAPGDADLSNPEIGPLVRRFLAGNDERAPDRYRLLKLAWEYTGDSFGSRQLLFEMNNAGTLPINRTRLLNVIDPTPLVESAKGLAGIPGADVSPVPSPE